MSGAGKGDIEFVIFVVGLVVTAVLLVITLIAAATHRGGAGKWFASCAGAFVVTVGLLAYI